MDDSFKKSLDWNGIDRTLYTDKYIIDRDQVEELRRFCKGLQQAAGGLAHTLGKIQRSNRADRRQQ